MNVIQEQDNMEEEHLETKKQITEKMVAETENSIGSLANKRPNSPENNNMPNRQKLEKTNSY